MRRGLQFLLRALGTTAIAAGARGVLSGAREMPNPGVVSPTVDSEYRFYAAGYPVFGVLLLRAARAPERQSVLVRACGAGSLIAATGRLLSIRKHGNAASVATASTRSGAAGPRGHHHSVAGAPGGRTRRLIIKLYSRCVRQQIVSRPWHQQSHVVDCKDGIVVDHG